MKRALIFATVIAAGALWAAPAHADTPMQRCEYPPEPPMAWPADQPCPFRDTTKYTAPPPAMAPPIDPAAAPVATTAVEARTIAVHAPARRRQTATTTTTEPQLVVPLFVEFPPGVDF